MREPTTSAGDGETGGRRLRERSGLVLEPLVFTAVWFAPLTLDAPAHRLAAVLATVIILWVTEAIPMAVTAFLGVASAVALGVAPAAQAFAPFADPLVFVFVGTFMLARAIFVHGLDRRFAFAILGLRGVGDRPGRILAAYALVSCAISMWISNTATVAMMYPIGLSILAALESRAGARPAPKYAAALLLSNAFAASVGGLATPVGTPPNLIGIGFIRREVAVDVSFFTWMTLGLPATAVLLVVVIAMFRRAGVPRDLRFDGVADLVARNHAALGPWTPGQRNTMVAFAVTVALWVLPGAVALMAGDHHPLYRELQRHLPEGVVALFGAALLFLLPTSLDRFEFTLAWDEAVKIDWWIVFLYGGGMALGTLAFTTGLAEALGRSLTDMLGVRSGLGLLIVSTVLATMLSETTSNTASANMVVPVVIAFARAAGTDPVLPALGATMGASLGFMLPVSTPCNAIVYGSRRIPLTTMLRHGLLLDAVGIVVIVVVLSLLGPPLLSGAAP